ncbi:hypothetical protein GGI23_002621 [Coemansia sp. RSA 2559]|nr:hypothetical protein GGI23_002621 [Coemansia sp. RSA 2559]
MYESVPLPLSTKRMFNKCPRFIRNTDYPHIAYTPAVPDQPSSNRNSVATVYHSPRTSLDLKGFEDLEPLWSNMLNDGPSFEGSSASRSSIGSDTTLAENYPGANKRAGLFAKNMAAILALSSEKKLGNEGVQPSTSFAKVMKELVARKKSNQSSAHDQKPSTSFASVMKELVAKRSSNLSLETETTLTPASVQ